jgi:predicted DNA binding CopG/RHH family protein
MKKNLKIPKFKSENEERKFWAKVNLAEYLDPSDFEKVSFPNLKPTSHAISIRIPDYLIIRLKERANEINVPYQSLIKEYIAEGMVRDQDKAVYKA